MIFGMQYMTFETEYEGLRVNETYKIMQYWSSSIYYKRIIQMGEKTILATPLALMEKVKSFSGNLWRAHSRYLDPS